ncbi:MAG: hypothetical protein ACFFCW_26290 [Candidatus Hodarchaeota archaeon]
MNKETEKIAVCTYNPRTSALLYDKIFWQPIYEIQGDNWQFYGMPDSIKYFPGQQALNEFGSSFDTSITEEIRSKPEANLIIQNLWMKMWADYCADKFKLKILPVYASLSMVDSVYQIGDYHTLIPILANIGVVSEDQLSWEHIEHFRKDRTAHNKYKRLLHWLDKEMVGKPQSFIEDEIAIRIEDYEASLKKHGIKTVLGTLEYILGDGFIKSAGIAIGAAVAGGLAAGLVAGGGFLIGQTAVKVVQRAYDLRESSREEKGELAYVFDLMEKI